MGSHMQNRQTINLCFVGKIFLFLIMGLIIQCGFVMFYEENSYDFIEMMFILTSMSSLKNRRQCPGAGP